MSDRASEYARLYVEEGLSYGQIAERNGVSRQYVGQILTPLKLANGKVSKARAEMVAELTAAHGRIMRRESTLREEAEKAGFKHSENFRAKMRQYGLRVNLDRTPAHGTFARYKSRKWRCRCEDCTRANREYVQSLKEKEPPEHGTESAYSNYGCRCRGPGSCTEAHRLAERERRAARRKKLKAAA